jgi:TRAP-type C4-dicarboxylate transport system substrate-binding protein
MSVRLQTAVAFALALIPLSAGAEKTVEIKLGTLAPKGSTWDVKMREMAQAWSAASGGRVRLRIYPGGTLGNEGDMVRKMRVKQINAAALTTIGLHDIAAEPTAVDVPMGISSYDELDYVMGKLEQKLNASVEAKGYVVLAWSDVGFVRFFSTRTFDTPKGAKEAKVFAWDGDPDSVMAWKEAGFHPVVLSSTDIVPSLQTGMIDTIATAPLYAFTTRIYQKANHMVDLPWALVNGATVVRKDVWEEIPLELRQKLLQTSREYGRTIQLQVRQENEDAIREMKKQGLQVVAAQDLPAWTDAAARANKVVRGKVVPEDFFDEVARVRKEYRNAHAAPPPPAPPPPMQHKRPARSTEQ